MRTTNAPPAFLEGSGIPARSWKSQDVKDNWGTLLFTRRVAAGILFMLLLSATSPSKANEPRKRRRKSAHGFPGVRSGQGRGRDKFQGCLPGKEKTTDLFDTPEEAAAALRQLEQQQREAKAKLPDFAFTQVQPAAAGGRRIPVGYVSPLPTLQLARMPLPMPRVSIGRSMWPLPVGSNPNSHGCEVVVAQLLPAMPGAPQ